MMQNAMRSLSPSATDMIRMDHTHVNATFHRYKAETDPQTKQALAEMIFMALEVHATIEEEIFYPAMREVQADRPVVDKSYPEHAELKRLIAKLREMQPTDPLYDKLFLDLMRDVLHHVADEETTLLPDAEAALGTPRLQEIGGRMLKRRMELTAPMMPAIAKNMFKAAPATWMVVAAGAMLGMGLMARRAFAR